MKLRFEAQLIFRSGSRCEGIIIGRDDINGKQKENLQLGTEHFFRVQEAEIISKGVPKETN